MNTLSYNKKISFDINDHTDFYLFSPATLMAKKNYCISHGIDFTKRLYILRLPWKKLIKMINTNISEEDAKKEGVRLTRPYKQRYDAWMREYRKYGAQFAIRRGRRLITRI